jgi:hypothetical protein
MSRNCDICGKKYNPDPRNLKRGWGLTCSKSCAAKKRERSRPGYDAATVAENNVRRRNWNQRRFDNDGYDPGDSEYWDSKDYN